MSTPLAPEPASEPHKGFRACVGIVVVNDAGKVFVGRRIGIVGGWQMPQGGIDKNEPPIEAALRELEEETGIPRHAVETLQESRCWYAYMLPEEIANRSWRGRFKGQTQKWFLLRFTGSENLIDLNTHHPEFEDWAWWDAETVTQHIIAFKRNVYEAVLTEFKAGFGPTTPATYR